MQSKWSVGSIYRDNQGKEWTILSLSQDFRTMVCTHDNIVFAFNENGELIGNEGIKLMNKINGYERK